MFRFASSGRALGAAVLGALLLGGVAPAAPAKAANALFVTTNADVMAIDGACSLREAINVAGSNGNHADCGPGSSSDSDHIFLQGGATYTLTRTQPANPDNLAGDLDILDNAAAIDMYLIGDPQNPPTIRAAFAPGSESRVLHVADDARVYLQYLAISGGKDESGAGIQNFGDLTLTDVAVYGNKAEWGAGIENRPGAALTIGSGSDIHHNISETFGGGVYNQSASVVVEGSSMVRSNSAVKGGAGVYSRGPNQKPALLTIRETSLVQGNTAGGSSGFGAGVLNEGGSGLLIEDSTIAQNTANGQGGGLYVGEGSALTMRGSSLAYNVARAAGGSGAAGGGLANYATATLRTSSIFSNHTGNAAGNTGGGIHNGGTLLIERSALYGNATIGSQGGAIYTNGTLTLVNTTLNKNSGTFAVYAGSASVGVHNSTITGNSGGLALSGNAAASVISRSIIAGNSTLEDCLVDNKPSSTGYNVLGADCAAFAVASDNVGVDPKLLALANNGGPTKTNAVAGNSPARDMIPQGVCNVVTYESQKMDQRGTSRPQGQGCDAGAYEFMLELALPAPLPTIAKLLPEGATAGDGELLLTVSGTNFSNTSEVRLNGAPLDTTFVNQTTVTVLLPAASLAAVATHAITVYTPAPGGGTSNAAAFTVSAPQSEPEAEPPVVFKTFTPLVGR